MLSSSGAERQLRHRQPHLRHRGGLKTNAPTLLLSLVLLADKPEIALGWVHHARSTAGQQQQWDRGQRWARNGPTSTPAAAAAAEAPVAASPVDRRRVLQSAALRGRRSGRRSTCRLAGTTGGEPGKTFEAPVVEGAVLGGAAPAAPTASAAAPAATKLPDGATSRAASVTTGRDSVEQMSMSMSRSGAKGRWREAVEELEKKRSQGLKPVSCSSVCLSVCRVGTPCRGMSNATPTRLLQDTTWNPVYLLLMQNISTILMYTFIGSSKTATFSVRPSRSPDVRTWPALLVGPAWCTTQHLLMDYCT